MDAAARSWVAVKGGSVLDRPCAEGAYWVQCAAGHTWRARANNLAYSRSWCPECYGNAPLTIEKMCELAEGRGGKCLSHVYNGLKKHLQWECAYGHQWKATPNNVKNYGSWCPHCRVNVGEELVRATLEEAFPGETFDRTRREPWMEGLELDGYNEKLRLAFEYQGKQHAERVEHFQPNDGDFEAQLERDEKTAACCSDEYVTLLTIPHTVGFANIRACVRRELFLLAYEIAPEEGTAGEFYDRVRALGPTTARQYEHIVEVIRGKGGECLSPQYLGYRVPLRIRCGQGHEFLATPEAIDQPAHRGPRFCPECGGTRRKGDDELREKVAACGYEFLGVESREAAGRTRRFIKVRCPEGHEYETLWDNFCPKDDKPKKGCAACFHAANGAAKRGDIRPWCAEHGLTLTEAYKSATTLCRWRCARGHTFAAKLNALKQKESPCTECGLEDFAAANRLELQTPWTPQSGPTTALVWRCVVCRATFVASVISLGRKKSLCPTCT